MTVNEFINLCIDPEELQVEIYNLVEQKTVYCGWADEIPEEIEGATFKGFEPIGTGNRIEINI